MDSRVQSAAIFDTEITMQFVALRRIPQLSRVVQKMRVRLPRTRPGLTSSDDVQQKLKNAIQHMIQQAQSQLETLDVAGLRAAFAPLNETVYRMQGGQSHTVRLDQTSLKVLTQRLRQPDETFVLLQVPDGLQSIQREIVQLHLNCCALSYIPDFVRKFENLEVLALDGNTAFLARGRRSSSNDRNPEYRHVIDYPPHPTAEFTLKYTCPARLLKLPNSLGSMRALTTLSLCDMPEISCLPASFARLTGLTALVIGNCPKLVLTEDMGRMPSLTHLTLREDNCLNLPTCVGTWPLTHLTIKYDVDSDEAPDYDDYLPPHFLGSLSSTLESLHMDACLREHLNDMPLMPRLTKLIWCPPIPTDLWTSAWRCVLKGCQHCSTWKVCNACHITCLTSLLLRTSDCIGLECLLRPSLAGPSRYCT